MDPVEVEAGKTYVLIYRFGQKSFEITEITDEADIPKHVKDGIISL